MMRIWKKPFPLDLSPKVPLKRAFWIGLFIFLFLWVFRPFGLNELEDNILSISLGFGAVSFSITLLLGWIVFRLSNSHTAENWTVGKEILINLLHLFFIGLGNVMYAHYTEMVRLDPTSIFTYQLFTVAVGIFPVSAVIFIKEVFMNRNFSNQALKINSGFREKAGKTDKPDIIHLSSQNAEENLTLPVHSLLFIQAANNYAEVVYQDEGSIRKSLLRNTLKNIILEVKGPFFRCHKSYIVNLDRINHISGNAQGYTLHLDHTGFTVPVSRKHNDHIKKLLTAHP